MPFPITGTDPANMEARLAVMRLGSSRLGYMNPVLRMTVAGTDRAATHQIDKASVRITRPTEGPATATFLALGFAPVEGQVVVMAIGAISNVLFAGHITKVRAVLSTRATESKAVRYDVSCTDYTWLFNRQQVLRQYGPDNVESIIGDLVLTFTSGFTTNHVNQSLSFATGATPFTMETPMGCVTRLAREADAYVYLDPAKDLHFFAAGQDRAPQPHALSSAYKDYENVRHTVDLSQIITRVYIEGAGNQLSAQYNLSGTIILDDTGNFPSTEVDLRIGQYAPVDGRRFRWTKASGTTLAISGLGDETYADYIAMAPFPVGTPVTLWQIVEDTTAQAALAALEGGDGVHESYIQDRRLSNDGMLYRATGELNRYKNPVETITYRTHDPCSRPGAQVTVNLTAPITISGTFTIQNVVISAIEAAAYRHPWYEVTATSNRRTLFDLFNDAIAQRAS